MKHLKRRIPWCDLTHEPTATGFVVTVPVMVYSEANQRGHWAKKYKRANEQSKGLALALAGVKRPPLPVTVTLTRLYTPSQHAMDAEDNLRVAFKKLVDFLADWLIPGLPPGIADADPRIRWEYRQECGGVVGVRVEIAGGNDDD
jgi:hypothetical protein